MEPTQSSPKMGATAIILGLVIALLVAGSAYVFVKLPKKDEIIVPETPIVGNRETTGATPTSVLMYKDGSYTVLGKYNSPGGAQEIQITLTLKEGLIVDTTALPLATQPGPLNFQQKFSAGFKTLVVGKSIDQVTLDKVSGSSLTPKGFNDAVLKIQAQAKA